MQSAEWIATARMLRRSGFGTTGAAVDSALRTGDTSARVSSILDTAFAEDPGALSTPIPTFESAWPTKPTSDTKRAAFIERRRAQAKELTSWWLRRMVTVEEPALEKLTFIWHNHFATSANPVQSAQLMATQNNTIRELCLGDFRALAFAMLTDGAMLRWLNGNSNTAKSPNENLAREFMELFALGHGNGYSEADVREGARALTGWVVSNSEEIRLEAERHDARTKTVLGVKAKHDASSFCDVVLQQPASARFVAGRLWQQLASDTPPTADELDRIVQAYGPSRDLKALTHAILSGSEFLNGQASIINGPVDWFIGVLRTMKVSLDDPKVSWVVAEKLKSLGQLPFYPPSVGGWPKGQAWLSTSSAIGRIRAASMAVHHGDISPVADAPTSERLEAVAYLLGVGTWSDQTVETLSAYKSDPKELVVAAANTPEYLTT